MKKIKILHIITRLDLGGSATNTIETVARLDKNKYQVSLISGCTSDSDERILKLLAERRIDCTFVNDLKREINFFCDLKSFFKLYVEIKKGKFDLIHTHSSKAGILGRWAAWMAGIKNIVHTPHGHIFYGYFGAVTTKFFAFLERITAVITHKIITLTGMEKKDYIKFRIAVPEKFIPIYSGIDLARFKNVKTPSIEKRKEFNISPDAAVIGTVSRLDPIKGNKFLIEAIPDIISKFPEAVFLMIGSGEQKKLLEDKVRSLNIEKNVIFTGRSEDIPELLHMMDIFVLPSLNEGMGRVILEAMACGKPIISTTAGGIPELIENGVDGILVSPESPSGLAGAIIDLLGDADKRKKFIRNGLNKIDNKFSIEKMVENIECLYENILREREKDKR